MGKFKYNIKLSDQQLVKLNKAQDGTVTDLKEMLRVHKIALMVRPTGFGKTFTMVKLCNSEKYKHVIYVYPTDVIRQSIKDDYHDPKKEGGIVYAATPEEAKKHKNLPYIEFISYKKMLMDWEAFDETTSEMDDKDRELARQEWINQRFSDVDLLILDEAHMTGAKGFLKYWKYIHNLTQQGAKDSRLHVLGATATPLRTDPTIDIERDIFYYTYGNEKKSARIKDFTFADCWRLGILLTPYYTKGILDKDEQYDYLLGKLHKEIVGCEIDEDPTIIKRRGRSSKKHVVRALNDSRVNYTVNQFNIEKSKLTEAIAKVPSPSDLIYSAVNSIVPEKVQCGSYMRFLVFYQNTSDMIKYHNNINKAIIDAFNIGGEDSAYTTLNSSYILTNEEKLSKSDIVKSKVDSISDRDTKLKDNPELGQGNIDLIHSINMLNMGYHVGHVTGVIIKRSTSSEIIYYQQIGRCMSIKAETKPIIIDFANAEAELFNGTHDTVREEAAEKIKEFINQCDLSDEYEITNEVYRLINSSISEAFVCLRF